MDKKSLVDIILDMEDTFVLAVRKAYSDIRDNCKTVDELKDVTERMVGTLVMDNSLKAFVKRGFGELLIKEELSKEKEEAASGN